MLNIFEIVLPTTQKINKYENVTKFNINRPTFNL
jgi:hypothetical protein